MNIILIGYRCSGKSAVARLLAQKLRRRSVDLDEAIEAQAGCDIKLLVSRKGWDYFRKMERQIIRNLKQQDHLVVATGGGAVMNPLNVKDLKANKLVIYLQADAKVVRRRMQQDQLSGNMRPALTQADPLQEIETVLRDRIPLYLSACDFTVDTSSRSLEEVAQAILDHPEVKIETGLGA